MTEAMEAEFDTVAEWTAEVAAELGSDYYVPAACRGSGSPPALDWLINEMGLTAGATLVDSGAGVGGPAAYAAQSCGVLPLLVEPEAGACRAANRLFESPVLCADGAALPIMDSSFDAAWSLGVLCTTADQLELLEELRRVVRPGGRIGLLVFVAQHSAAGNMLEGNHFPTQSGLLELVASAGLVVERRLGAADLPAVADTWTGRVETVERVLRDRHGHKEAWQMAERQSSRIGRLLDEGSLTGQLLVLHRA